jgi:hypothetical protein
MKGSHLEKDLAPSSFLVTCAKTVAKKNKKLLPRPSVPSLPPHTSHLPITYCLGLSETQRSIYGR